VPLGDVRDLVRDDGRKFGLVAGGPDQARVDADDAPGHREGIDLTVLDRQKVKRARRVRRV